MDAERKPDRFDGAALRFAGAVSAEYPAIAKGALVELHLLDVNCGFVVGGKGAAAAGILLGKDAMNLRNEGVHRDEGR